MPTSRDHSGVDLDAAIVRLRDEGCVAYPTETVWGLGACASSDVAIARLRAWKGRSDRQPISLLVADPAEANRHGIVSSARAEALMTAFWPGPLTLILPCTGRFAAGIGREDGAVGVRCSAHPIAAALAAAAADADLGPLTATSLNRSGEPPARREAEARLLCPDDGSAQTPLIVDVGASDAGDAEPSTVLDLTGAEPHVLRLGAIGAEALARHSIDVDARI